MVLKSCLVVVVGQLRAQRVGPVREEDMNIRNEGGERERHFVQITVEAHRAWPPSGLRIAPHSLGVSCIAARGLQTRLLLEHDGF